MQALVKTRQHCCSVSLIGNEEVNGQRSESNPPQMEKKKVRPLKKNNKT
jgi:hypothetical protein